MDGSVYFMLFFLAGFATGLVVKVNKVKTKMKKIDLLIVYFLCLFMVVMAWLPVMTSKSSICQLTQLALKRITE